MSTPFSAASVSAMIHRPSHVDLVDTIALIPTQIASET